MCSAMWAMPGCAPSKREPARTATAMAVSGPGAGSWSTVSAPCWRRTGSRGRPAGAALGGAVAAARPGARGGPPAGVGAARGGAPPPPAHSRPARGGRGTRRRPPASPRLDQDRLTDAELPQPLGAAVTRADAALLDAAEGQPGNAGGDEALVDAGVAALDALREGDAALDVTRPHARVEPVAAVVGEPQRLIGIAHGHDRDHGAESLLAHDEHRVIDAAEHRGLVEVPGAVAGAPAAEQHLGSLALRVIDVTLDDLDLPRARERAVVDVGV